MPLSRKLFVPLLAFCGGFSTLSCSPSPAAQPQPSPAVERTTRPDVIEYVKKRNPNARLFKKWDGDEQYVSGTIYGVIEPHRNAHKKKFEVGKTKYKMLARIRVSSDYPRLSLKGGKWYYWLLADVGTTTPNVINVYVAEDFSESVDGVHSMIDHEQDDVEHDHAIGRWRNQSDAVPWATCGPSTCCCEGPNCNDFK